MSKKTNVIESLVLAKQKEFETQYGKNFRSMYEFEGLIRSFINEADFNIRRLRKINKLLQAYTVTQEVEDQLKVEATRVELKDYSICAVQSLINCAAALDNFNFNEMIEGME